MFLVALPVLYVLSIGPVVAIASKTKTWPGLSQQFYAPVIWLHDHTLLRRPLEIYVALWGVK